MDVTPGQHARFQPLVLVLIALAACDTRPIELGAAVDATRAEPVGQVLTGRAAASDPADEVVVRGKISAVCAASGCWVVLQEVAGGKVYELLTDLAPAALSLPATVQGREAIASGRLVGSANERRLRVSGIVVR